jgi:hypothetical protein
MSRTFIPRAGFSVLLFLAAGYAAADGPKGAADGKGAVGGVEGMWNGRVQMGSGEMHVIFHINKKGDDFTATMDSPDQSVYGLACDRIGFRNDKLIIVLSQIEGVYEGKLSSDGKEINGVWIQGGETVKLDLSRMNPLLSPQMLTLASWIPLIFLSAFFLRMACSFCQGELPSWTRSLISVVVVSFLAYLTFDFSAYMIMRSLDDVAVHIPEGYSYKLWFREPLALKWIIISQAGRLRYLPFVFALCAAGTLQVIILQASVTFRVGLVIVLLQWGATAVAGYIMTLLMGVALSEADKAQQATPVSHPPAEVAQGKQKHKPATSGRHKAATRQLKGEGKAKTDQADKSKTDEEAASPSAEPTSLQVAKGRLEDATKSSREYAETAWKNLRTYADSHLDDLKEELGPVTERLPQPVQNFLEKGGWWAILGVLGFIALLWLRAILRRLGRAIVPSGTKKKRGAKSRRVKLTVDLSKLGRPENEAGSRRLTVKGVPARLRLVILSSGTKMSRGLNEDMVDRVLDWIKPGLALITGPDEPRVRLWPPFYSSQGFTSQIRGNVTIPEPKGKRSKWVVVSGRMTMGVTTLNVGLVLFADEPTTLRHISIPDEQWLGALGVKDSRQRVH